MNGAGPRLYALLGDPVAHTLSPPIHRAAFRAAGRDAAYGALRVGAAELEPVMRVLARQGGGNVTLPHKERAAALVEVPSPAVRATGACNCFWGTPEGEMAGDNTDVEGFRRAAAGLLPGGLEGASVLLLGAGGAARAVLHACVSRGAAAVHVLNRTRSRAERMVRESSAAPDGGEHGDAEAGSDAGEETTGLHVLPDSEATRESYHLVVNATSLGLEPGDPSPLSLEGRQLGAVLDLVYGRGAEPGTTWVDRARELGIPAADGLEMLVYQAAASQRRWGVESPPEEAMTEAARAALATSGGTER